MWCVQSKNISITWDFEWRLLSWFSDITSNKSCQSQGAWKIDLLIEGNRQSLCCFVYQGCNLQTTNSEWVPQDRSSFCNILGPNISSYFKRQPVAITHRLKINNQFVRKNKLAMLEIFKKEKFAQGSWEWVSRWSNTTMIINNPKINNMILIQYNTTTALGLSLSIFLT